MYVSWQSVITTGAILSALSVIFGAIVLVIKWVKKPEDVNKKVKALEKKHDADTTLVKRELCILSDAMLAALDGLIQQGCNGEVTKAHSALEKHLNKQAHDIHSEG